MLKSFNKGISTPVGILLVILILVVLGGGVLSWQRGWLLKPSAQTPETTVTPTPTPTETPQAGPIDCKTNFDCLIEASKSCTPAKVTRTATVDIFGVKESSTGPLEIRGMDSNRCVLYTKTGKVDLTFPPDTSLEIINQQKEIYKKLEGLEGICKFKTNDLTAMLIRWKQGDFDSGTISCKFIPGPVSCKELPTGGRVCAPEGGKSVCTTEGGDFGAAECSGTYFEQLSL